MSLSRFKTKLALAKIQVKRSASEQKDKIKEIHEKMPSTGDDIGKAIENKLNSIQKTFGNFGIAMFSTTSIENASHYSSYLVGMFTLIITSFIIIFPTDKKALQVGSILTNLVVIIASLLLLNILTYVAMRLMGSKTPFKAFFSTVNMAVFMSIITVAIPMALVAFALFSTMLKSQDAINLFFSMLPFYNYLIYGWTTETLSGFKGIKSVIIALIALTLILFFKLLLPVLLV